MYSRVMCVIPLVPLVAWTIVSLTVIRKSDSVNIDSLCLASNAEETVWSHYMYFRVIRNYDGAVCKQVSPLERNFMCAAILSTLSTFDPVCCSLPVNCIIVHSWSVVYMI